MQLLLGKSRQRTEPYELMHQPNKTNTKLHTGKEKEFVVTFQELSGLLTIVWVCESLSYLTNPYQLQRLFIISSIA
jgi:hypothetical protein